MFKITKISSADLSGRVTPHSPSLPPIEYESIQSNTEYPPKQNKRLAAKGKSGIPVYAGRKTPSMLSYTGQNKKPNLNRVKSFDKIDRDERNYKERDNRYRNGGALSRAGNHPRLNRAYSDNSLTRLPPISPGRRRRVP